MEKSQFLNAIYQLTVDQFLSLEQKVFLYTSAKEKLVCLLLDLQWLLSYVCTPEVFKFVTDSKITKFLLGRPGSSWENAECTAGV